MSSRTLYNKGLVLLNLKRYKESIDFFDRVINLKQDNIADAYTSKATALDYLKEPEEAERFYALAVDEYSTRISKLNEEAESLLKSGDYEKSLKLVEQILTIESNNPHGLYLKALALFNLKRYKESIPVFEKYLEIDSNNVKALSYLGQAYFFYKQYDKAISFFDKVIYIKQKVDADDADTRYYKGNALLYLNRLPEAEEELKKALMLYKKTEGTKEKMMQSLKMLRSIYSNYYHNFDFNKSLSFSQELTKLDKDRIEFKLMLAEDYIKSHNIPNADRLLNEIQDFPYDNDGEKYKEIQRFLKLCSNFLDINESNDHIGLTDFYKFFTSKEFNDSRIASDFWDFNAIKYVIEESPLASGKINILLAIISYYQYQTIENKKNVEYLITSYLGETTIKQAEKISETTNQYKKLKLLVIFTIIGIVALLATIGSYYSTVNYNEYPTIVVPDDVEDWSIDSENEKLHYITKSGKFVEYDLRRDRSDYVSSELSTIFGNNRWMNQFLYDMIFTRAERPTLESDIGGQPMKLIHDENKDFTFVIDRLSKNITVINNGEIFGKIALKGTPTDIEFEEDFIYISTKKPNTLSIFKYPTLDSEIKKINTINLIHNPAFIVDDKDNNVIFLINSDSSTLSFMNLSSIENNFEIIQQLSQEEYIKNVNLLESNFVPIDTSYNDDNNQLIVHNLKNQELIIIDATNLEKLKDNNIKDFKKKIPFEKSYSANIEIGNNNTFISVPNTKTIHVIKPSNDTKIRNDIFKIKFDDTAIGKINFDDKNDKLFIHLTSNNTIIPFNFNNLKPGDHINVGRDPFAMIHDNDNSILYVTNTLDNSISMIDTIKNDEIDNIPVGIWPNDITFDNDANKVFVVNSNSNGRYYNGPSTITIIDKSTNEPTHHLTGGYGSSSLGVDEIHKKIYISNSINSTVSVLDYNGKILSIIDVNLGPVDIAVNPSNGLVYVANYDDDSISIIDTKKYNVIQTLTVGDGPNDIAVQNVSDSKSKIFIVNQLSDTVSVIEIDNMLMNNYYHKVTNTISVGKYPTSAAFFENNKNKNLYVSNTDNTISVINIESPNIFPKGSISIKASTNPDLTQVMPSGIAVNSKNNMLYVSSAEYDMVSLYNGTDFEPKQTLYPVNSIQAGKNPYGIKVNQFTGDLYVPNLQSDSISIFFKDESFPTEINVANISYIDIDQYSGKLYVAHKYSNSISVYTFNSTDKNFKETNTIFIGYSPSCIFVDESNSRLLVAGNNMLTVYDLSSLQLIEKNIPVGLSANSIAVNELMNIIYLNDPLEDEFLILNGITYQPVLPDFPEIWARDLPSSIAVNQKTGDIYISNKNSDSVTKFDSFTMSFIEISEGIGKSPNAIAINAQKDRAYVVNEKSHTVSIIDTLSNKTLKNVAVGKYPNSIDLDIYNDDIYVTSSYTNNIYKFHDNTITKKITSSFNEESKILSYLNLTKVRFVNTTNGDSTSSILPFKGNEIISDSKNVYVSSIEGKLISRISLNDNNLTNLEINAYPSSIALYPSKNQLYILDGYDQRILVIDINKFKIAPNFEISLDSVENISSPDSITVDPKLNKIYVTDKDSHSIFMIDIGTGEINEIHLSGSPSSIAVDPKTHKVYGTYDTTNSIFVIQNTTAKNIDFQYKWFIPKDIFFTDLNILILDSDLKSVILLDNNDIIKSISDIPYPPKFKDPEEISIDAKSKKIYAINSTDYSDINISEIEYSKYSSLPDLISRYRIE
jgi:YVTN family beta-propeller protein